MSQVDDDDGCWVPYVTSQLRWWLSGVVCYILMKMLGVGYRISHVNDDDGYRVLMSRLSNTKTLDGVLCLEFYAEKWWRVSNNICFGMYGNITYVFIKLQSRLLSVYAIRLIYNKIIKCMNMLIEGPQGCKINVFVRKPTSFESNL